MKSTREKILRTLLAFPGSTINDMAEAVGINGISIRHHLTSLEAEGLITSAEERHGVGRPRFIYRLSEKGIEEFPTSYLKLTKRLLESLKNRFSTNEFIGLLEEIGSNIANSYKDEIKGKTLEERITLLKSIMTKEGFIVDWEKNEEDYTITSYSCPYYRVRIDHPEICVLDHQLITQILSKPVQIESCIFTGDDHCTYRINMNEKDNSNE
ncbi:MAG: winged helix-turn-helix transcriptional regulator [Chloroflexota bacterium]|nr:winged helix-turn-helix transcriptional regulator [Chloroflexota bacterium]